MFSFFQKALMIMSRTHAPGEKPYLEEIKEQRVTNFAIHMLMGELFDDKLYYLKIFCLVFLQDGGVTILLFNLTDFYLRSFTRSIRHLGEDSPCCMLRSVPVSWCLITLWCTAG